ncbi:hypothetical protein KIP88_18815 [Bradyrhizobium sp. SRL28]|uniref:hypothetical protein n=1 Tax=Bradyrhizobium sp. SRL28 TaxID=2836178 RepID=UPI001BDE7684|nr:hypothetical protein [Bradyrhizobium sp. SRL28]MBT1512559.1 hypothetical protein [Bradyrhizobium sp. SRL28]
MRIFCILNPGRRTGRGRLSFLAALQRLTDIADRTTLPAMRATMTTKVPIATNSAGVRYVAVSLPRIDCLLADQPGRYFAPGDEPPPTRSDLSARTWSRFQRRRLTSAEKQRLRRALMGGAAREPA